MAMNNSPVLSHGNGDLELGETGFRGNKDNKKKVTNIHNRHHIP